MQDPTAWAIQITFMRQPAERASWLRTLAAIRAWPTYERPS